MRRSAGSLLGVCAAWVVLAAGLTSPPAAAQAKVDFSRDVLPILSDKCFKCHGPDAGTRSAGLRLDTPEGAYENRRGKFAIVPGKPEHSMVVQRINHASMPMPPEGSGKTLSSAEKETLTRWISEGAKYGQLWSMAPLPKRVPVPNVAGSWPRDDLDRFILDRLNREKLEPSPPADPLRWLRRVSLDLTGLPPTEDEILAFRQDHSRAAEERVVDRLLASPHFGERIAVDWLDAARYSDSYGYQSDLLMPSWPYRDWVVRAFNDNKPYNEFLIEQLAGDLLPNATREQRLATAFNRLHRQSNEGGSIPLEFKTEYAVDRVDTFGTSVLGLTLGCARCHDHKFDPITQKEYYQLFAYFNSIDEYGLLLSTEIVPTPSLLLPDPEQEGKLSELEQSAKDAKADYEKARAEAVKNLSPGLTDAGVLGRWSLDELKDGQYVNEVDASKPGIPIGGVKNAPGRRSAGLQFSGDDGVLFKGLPARERFEAFSWGFWVKDLRQDALVVLLHRTGGTDVGFCGFDLMLEDGRLTARVMRHWPGNAVAVRTVTALPDGEWAHVGWTWDGSGTPEGLRLFINGQVAETKVVAGKLWKKIHAYGDLGPSGGEWSFAQRFRDAGFKGGEIDDVVFAGRALEKNEMAAVAQGRPIPTTPFNSPAVLAAAEAMKAAQAALTNFEESIREISVMEDAPREIPAYLLARGQYDAPRTEETRVQRGVPAALPGLGSMKNNNRLALARWATAPDHPLTARVAVNRLWQMVFGTGLAETSENFGAQGSQPTHPELLDFLARRFVDSGWDVKATIRAMVLSSTYRQDSALVPTVAKRDPQNRLYARGPSQRLSAEMIRDVALAGSGLLVDKQGGPPVNPYQPAGIWSENNTMSPGFVQSKGEGLYRRSLYSTVKRTTPVPSMLTFDATSREACATRRPATNTPLQALVLLNDVQFVEAARVLAEKIVQRGGSLDQMLTSAFLRLASREPDEGELRILRQCHREQMEIFRGAPEDAKKLTSIGESPFNGADAVRVAAMTSVVQLILNSDSVVWKR